MTLPAVLLLIFNRPDHLRHAMAALHAAKPPRVYVAADGPRAKSGEFEACREARKVATEISWPCEVHTLFRDHNLGCRVAVSTAIDWFFSHEEQGIILEDDCVPSQSFFPYCAELLDRYRDDTRIMSVSGNNFQRGRQISEYSYYFSKYMHCWGWATWRRAWNLYDREMLHWPAFKAAGGLRSISEGSAEFEEVWAHELDKSYCKKINTWDYSFLFSCWANSGLTCLPAINLVSNIGFDAQGTHLKNPSDGNASIVSGEIQFPLMHPPVVFRSAEADKFEDLHVYKIRKKNLSQKMRGKANALRKNIKYKLGFAPILNR
jgi:hypothetical protein